MTTKFVYSFVEGNKDLKDLRGEKEANLAELIRIGIPVPAIPVSVSHATLPLANRANMEIIYRMHRAKRSLARHLDGQ